MGTRGPLPTPTQILALRGSPIAKTRPNEPRPPVVTPDPPPTLSAAALSYWRYYAPKLAALRVLTELDQDTLARYCMLNANLWALAERIEHEGFVDTDDKGRATARPEYKMMLNTCGELGRLTRALGLSPADRVRLSVEQEQQSAADRFLA